MGRKGLVEVSRADKGDDLTWNGGKCSSTAITGAETRAAAVLGEEEEATNVVYNPLDFRSLLETEQQSGGTSVTKIDGNSVCAKSCT